MQNNGMDAAKTLKRLEHLLGVARIGIDIIDSHFNIRYIDPAWKKVYGESAGKKCYQYFMGRSAICPDCGVVKALKTKKIIVTEERLAREGDRPIEVTTIPFRDENGDWLVAETNVDVTHTKLAEAALHEGEEAYRQLFGNSRDAIFVADAKMRRTIDCNIAAEKLTGYSKKELLSIPATQIIPPHLANEAKSYFRRLISGERFLLESEILTKDKHRVPVEIAAAPLQYRGKKCLMGAFRDISLRKRTEEALCRSENMYRMLFEESNDAIFVADARTRNLVDCNKKAEKMTGYSRNKILSMRADDLHPQDVVRHTMEDFKKQASGARIVVDSEVLTKDKNRIPVSISTALLKIGGKNLSLGVFRNITERKRSEDALKELNSLLSSTIESTFNGILVVDRNGKITRLNKKFQEMWRIPQSVMATHDDKKALGFVVSQLKDPGAFLKKVSELYRKPERESYDVLEFKDGRVFERYSRPQRIGPDIIGRVWTFHDITERRAAEEVLKRDKKYLEKLVSDRSKELLKAQEDLGKAKRLSELGMLSATVAHELRTPLAAIRTAAYNIKKKSDNPLLETNLANIEKKVVESDQIIKSLLTYSHIKVPRYEEVDVCALMNECVSLAKEIYHGYKVTVRMPGRHPKNCVVEVDPIQLKEVFTNILNNAYESFPQQKGRIWLSAVTTGNYIKISIRDNGHGVDKDGLKRIAEPFFTTKAKGTGLGLSICQQIIEMHDGKIKIESRVNKGTTVTVSLPIKRSPAQPA